MPALGLEALLHLVPLGTTPEQMKALDLKKKSISKLPTHMRMFTSLRKLDLSHNELTCLEPLRSLVNIANLNVSHNKIRTLLPLSSWKALVVLNVAGNALQSLEGLPVEAASKTLKALIANENQIVLSNGSVAGASSSSSSSRTAVGGKGDVDAVQLVRLGDRNRQILEMLLVCEVVVLSRNAPLLVGSITSPSSVDSAPNEEALHPDREQEAHPLSVFASLPALKKLCLSECQLPSLPTRWFLPMVTELRLAKNALTQFPETVILRSVQVLDVAHNQIPHVEALRRCKFLQHLSARGNPFAVSGEDFAHDENTHRSDDDVSGDESAKKKNTTTGQWFQEVRTRMILTRMFSMLKMVDSSPFHPISKEEYLAARRDEAKQEQRLSKEEGVETEERLATDEAAAGSLKRAKRSRQATDGNDDDEGSADGPRRPSHNKKETPSAEAKDAKESRRPAAAVVVEEDVVLELEGLPEDTMKGALGGSGRPIIRRITKPVDVAPLAVGSAGGKNNNKNSGVTPMSGSGVAAMLKQRKQSTPGGW